jgi:hypothetical protein
MTVQGKMTVKHVKLINVGGVLHSFTCRRFDKYPKLSKKKKKSSLLCFYLSETYTYIQKKRRFCYTVNFYICILLDDHNDVYIPLVEKLHS